MSEFGEKHNVSRLIGAPPGYVGYDEGGILTESVRRKPYSVILLDEVEKAHQDVFNVLLQVLDDGRLTDGQGRTVDFKNTVIVMTSNLGSREIQSSSKIDYNELKNLVMNEVKEYFRPEFINRIDEVLIFNSLDEQNIQKIAQVQIDLLNSRFEKMNMKLEVSPKALLKIAQNGYDPIYGARPLKRAIQNDLEDPLSIKLLKGEIKEKDTIMVDWEENEKKFIFKTSGALTP